MPARWPVHSSDCTMMSLVMMSSFFCVSPWTFSVSAEPCRPISGPRLTAQAIFLQDVSTSLSREVKSPVAPGMRRCSSMMNWVSDVVCSKSDPCLMAARKGGGYYHSAYISKH